MTSTEPVGIISQDKCFASVRWKSFIVLIVKNFLGSRDSLKRAIGRHLKQPFRT